MRIGELSREANVSIDTVRYYERRGLLEKVARRESGYREFSEDDLRRLKFIVHAKDLGFTLDEIGRLLSIRSDGSECESVKALAEAKAKEVEERINKMSRMKSVLLALARQCEDKDNLDPCPCKRGNHGLARLGHDLQYLPHNHTPLRLEDEGRV